MFDAPRYPKNRKDTSVDMRLMFGYHIGMMVLFVTGGLLTVRQELLVAAAIATVAGLVAGKYREISHWKWPGVRNRDMLYAIAGVAFITFFLYSASPLFPPRDHRFLPWYLAGLGIGVFNILHTLKVVATSKAEFAAQCVAVDQYGRELPSPPSPPLVQPQEEAWKKTARTAYSIAFMAIWVAGVASFYFFGTSFKNGSPEPTATQTERLNDHGKIVYITPVEKKRVDGLQLAMSAGVPLILISGAVLHFLVGVKLLANVPTLAEYQKNKTVPRM